MIFRDKLKVQNLPVEKILPNPSQPRKSFSEKELFGLAVSIRENGVLQPVTVRKEGGKFYLVAGERRLRASKMAGLKEIPAIISECSSEDSAILAILENIQREDLNMFEQANAIVNLVRSWDLTQEQAAKRLGISQSYLSNKLRLLKLEPEEQDMILKSNLTERHARSLLKVSDLRMREKILEVVVNRRLNVAQTEMIVKQATAPDIEPEAEEKAEEPKIKKKKPLRTFIAKDIRIFINTIDHAVDAMLTAGIKAETAKKETDDYIECIVRIPKPAANTKKSVQE